MNATIESLLARVSKPARYTGGEVNSITKDWAAVPLHVALAYPDAYEIGMSNMGLGILYDILNRIEQINRAAIAVAQSADQSGGGC